MKLGIEIARLRLFTFSYPYKKVLLWDQIFEMEILMDLHVLRTSELKNYTFSGWSVCICVRLSVCVSLCHLAFYIHTMWHSTFTSYIDSIRKFL